MMTRPQFSLKTLLWLMAVVAAFCAGMAWQYKVLGIRATKRQQELEAAYYRLRKEHQHMVSIKFDTQRKLETVSKKLSDAGIDSGESD